MKCPGCGFDQPDSKTSCEACGLIFAKYDPILTSPREKWRQEREAQETPENGWTTHHLGKMTWKSTGWTTTSNQGTSTIGGFGGGLLSLIVLSMFLGFPFAFIWPRKVMPVYFMGMVFLVGLFLFVQSFSKLRKKREMEDIPLSTIRAMAPGQVEIRGVAVETEPLTAPLSGKPCVYYEYNVERFVQQGKESSWVSIQKDGSRDKPITLDDGTGRARVHPGGADTIFAKSYRVKAYNGKGLPDKVMDFAQTKGLADFLKGQLRFTECCFTPGQEVFVMGVCRKNDEAQSGEGEVYVGKGDRPEDLYILSDKSREAVERQYLWSALVSIFFGLALIAGSIYGFLKMAIR